MQFSLYSFLLILSLLLSLATCFASGTLKNSKEGRYFLYMMIAASVWSLFGLLATMTVSLATKLVLAKWLYFGVTTVPVFYMLFVLEYTQNLPKLKPQNYVLLFTFPALFVMATFTNQFHHLMWKDVILVQNKISGITAYYYPGPIYWLIIGFSYCVILFTLFILLRTSFKFPRQYSKQISIVFFSMIIPLVGNMLYSFNQGEFRGVDLTPVTFSVAGFLLLVGMKSHGLLRIKPLARDFLFESLHDGVLFMDSENQIIDYNQAATRILKLNFGRDMMKNCKNIQKNYPALYDICTSSVETDHEIMLSATPTLYYNVQLHRLFDHWNHTIGKVVLLHDVTDQKKSQDIINQKNKELAQMNRQKDTMFSIVSHDLRSPFSAMIGMAELMKENYDAFSDKDRIKFLHQLINRTKITYDLLENLLQWSKSHVSGFVYSSGNINLVQQVADVVEMYSSLADDKNLHIKVVKEINELHPEISGNDQLLNIILRNLLTNAIKFTPDEGFITIKYEYLANHCLISVKDTGVGISAKSLTKLFDPENTFYTNGTKGETGSGLGLILCKEFVEKMGGKIWLDSIPGTGTIIYFTLPYANVTPSEFNAPSQSISQC